MSIRTRRSSKRGVAAAVTAALGVSLLAMSSPAGAVTPNTTGTRIAGSDRYSTSALLATNYVSAITSGTWKGNVVVAAGTNFPDALAASSIASVRQAPILLVPSDGTLPTAIRDWLLINRAEIQTDGGSVTIVGGTSAVTDATKDAILGVLNEGLATATVTATRLSGADRYATAAAVNAATGVIGAGDSAILVSGANFADAVSAAPLAFAKGWPIVLTPGTTLGASATATLTALKTASPSGKVIIVGGKATIAEGIETELVDAGFAYSNIVRIAGPDRYITSALVNQAMVTPLLGGQGFASPQFGGANVALVSGENFADAVAAAPFLAAKTGANEGIHLQLTASGSLSLGAAGLISTLAGVGAPAKLFAIGGTSAVSTATFNAGVSAAQSTNMAGTMTCLEGATSVSITFPKALGTGEKGAISAASLSINGGSNTGSGVTASAGDTVMTIGVPALAAGSSVTFAGVTEAQSDTKRALSAPSCTVADDSSKPSASFVISAQQASNNTAGSFVVEFSEPVAFDSIGANLATASAIAKFDLTDLTVTTATGAAFANPYTATASAGTALDAAGGFASKFLVRVNDITTSVISLNNALGVKVAIAADATKDVAGNGNTAGSGTVAVGADADSTKPTFTTSVTSTATTNSAVTNGGLTLTASSTGAFAGVAGNGWKLSVENKRGQVVPTVVADATAKTVVVTADVAYTSAADVVQYVKNNGLLSGWTLTAAGTLAAAAASPTAGGANTAVVTFTASEYMKVGNLSAVPATLNGVTLVGGVDLTQGAGLKTYTTSVTVGVAGSSLVVVMPAAAYDLNGNSGAGTITVAL